MSLLLFTREFGITTRDRIDILNITDRVESVLEESEIKRGFVHVYTQHTTCAIVINEDESGLLSDFRNLLERLVPRGAGYAHDRIDDNADSHLRAMLLGNSEIIPVDNGRMLLGTWQSIFFVELDGPRHRKCIVQVVGEK